MKRLCIAAVLLALLMLTPKVQAGCVSPAYMFKLGSIYVKLATTLYASKIAGYQDKLVFYQAYTEGEPCARLAVNASTTTNVTITLLNKDFLKFTLAEPTATVYLEVPEGPSYVSIGDYYISSENFFSDYAAFQSQTVAVYTCDRTAIIKTNATDITVKFTFQEPMNQEETTQRQQEEYAPQPTPTPSPFEPTAETDATGLYIIFGTIAIAFVVLVASLTGERKATMSRVRKKWKKKKRLLD